MEQNKPRIQARTHENMTPKLREAKQFIQKLHKEKQERQEARLEQLKALD